MANKVFPNVVCPIVENPGTLNSGVKLFVWKKIFLANERVEKFHIW